MIDPQDPGTFDLKLPTPAKSNAERQRDFRKRQRQLKAEHGVKPFLLSERERLMIELIRSSGTGQPGTTDFPLANEVDSVLAQFKNKLASRVITGRSISFDDVVMDLLTSRDRNLLQRAQRNEALIAATPANKAYPADPEKRNLLGQALNDKNELHTRYQMLLDQMRELYEMLDVTQASPRLSTPASFVRDYKRYSEIWAITSSTEGEDVTKHAFKFIGRGIIKPNLDGLSFEVKKLVHDVGLVEALRVLAEKCTTLHVTE